MGSAVGRYLDICSEPSGLLKDDRDVVVPGVLLLAVPALQPAEIDDEVIDALVG